MVISANDKYVLEAINRCCGRVFRILPPSMTYSVLEQHEETQDAIRFNLQRIVSLIHLELSTEGRKVIDIPQVERIISLQGRATPFNPVDIQDLWKVARGELPELRATLFRVLSESSV